MVGLSVIMITVESAATNATSLPATQIQSSLAPVAEQIASAPVEYRGTMDPKAIRTLEETTIILLPALANQSGGNTSFGFAQSEAAQIKDFSSGFTLTGG